MPNEYRFLMFLSPELKYRRSLIEIIRRLEYVLPKKGFHAYAFNVLDNEYNMSDVQCKYKY